MPIPSSRDFTDIVVSLHHYGFIAGSNENTKEGYITSFMKPKAGPDEVIMLVIVLTKTIPSLFGSISMKIENDKTGKKKELRHLFRNYNPAKILKAVGQMEQEIRNQMGLISSVSSN